MERNMISWNFPNWVSVVLMASAGYVILGVIAQLLKRQQAGQGMAGG